jgi:hypothetical protein
MTNKTADQNSNDKKNDKQNKQNVRQNWNNKKNKKYKQNDRQNWHVKKNDNKKDKKIKYILHILIFFNLCAPKFFLTLAQRPMSVKT